jgi:hypothetical protein
MVEMVQYSATATLLIGVGRVGGGGEHGVTDEQLGLWMLQHVPMRTDTKSGLACLGFE